MFLVPLAHCLKPGYDICITRGLVLCLEERIIGIYRRIGTFETLSSSIYQRIYSLDSTLEDNCYERLDEQRQYTMRII